MKRTESFLPEDFVVETRERRLGIVAAVLFPMMVLAVFAAFLVTNEQWNEVRTAQAAIDEETERVAREISELRNLEGIHAHMDTKAELARGLLEPIPRSVLLALLANTMPSEVALTSFELRTEAIKPAKVESGPGAKPAAKPGAKSQAAKDPKRAAGTPEPPPAPALRRTNIVIVGTAPSLLEVGRWMTALEQVPIFASVRLELMEEKIVDGQRLSEFRIGVRIEPEADLRKWAELEQIRQGELPPAMSASLGLDGSGNAEVAP